MSTKRVLMAVALTLISGVAWGQAEPMKWGKIDPEDMEMKVYAPDTTAAAVVLGDYGDAYFTYNNDRGFQLNIVRHVRIKILKTEGLEWANVENLLYQSSSQLKEEMVSVKGITYNLVDGKEEKSKLSKNDIFIQEYNERASLHKFTMPNVKVGSVIEYEYHKLSDYIYSFETWTFQSTIPTRWSEFRAKVPEYFGYKHFMSGYNIPHINESESYQDRFDYKGESLPQAGGGMNRYTGTLTPPGVKYRWAMKDVPALKEEAYITTMADYASKMEFELKYTKFPQSTIKYFSSDWERLSKEFLEANRFGGELKKQKQVSDIVASITAGKQNPEEKMQAIYNFVQQNIKYNGLERVYMTNSFKEVLTKKEGNAAEINLLLTAMLREAKLGANPVIMSTRKHGRINPIIPLQKDFNYVVCHVKTGDDAYMLLDATDKLLPMGNLPYRCMNDQGRLVSEEFTTWIPLLNKERQSYNVAGKFKLSPTGSLTGTLSYYLDGYDAVDARRKIKDEGEEKFLQGIAGTNANWVIKEHKVDNLEILTQKLQDIYTLEISNKATPAGDKLYLLPLPAGLLESNPFKMEDRKFPVNFGCPLDKMLTYEIELPQGYVVEELPKPAVVTLPDKSAVFRYNIAQLGNKLTVTSSMQIKKPMYGAEEYQHLKQFYQLMLAKQNEQVVLAKQK